MPLFPFIYQPIHFSIYILLSSILPLIGDSGKTSSIHWDFTTFLLNLPRRHYPHTYFINLYFHLGLSLPSYLFPYTLLKYNLLVILSIAFLPTCPYHPHSLRNQLLPSLYLNISSFFISSSYPMFKIHTRLLDSLNCFHSNEHSTVKDHVAQTDKCKLQLQIHVSKADKCGLQQSLSWVHWTMLLAEVSETEPDTTMSL